MPDQKLVTNINSAKDDVLLVDLSDGLFYTDKDAAVFEQKLAIQAKS